MEKQRFCITTAISYPNGNPHIGHAYEAITADVIARSQRRNHLRDVRLCTGTDEHGLKMVQTARDNAMTPQGLASMKAALFQKMNDDLHVGYDRFIRTSSPEHHETAQKLWRRMSADLYLDKYTGWYSVRDEAYFDESELTRSDDGLYFTDTGNPVEWIEEESWFFRLTDYRDRLKQHFADNPDFLRPESSRNEILAMLDDLRDISVSRTTFDWGVPVPDSPGHVMYVWVDALANYLTGATSENENHWWPADLHVIGKDIAKFHAIYWPAFLMSANLALPKQIFCHGHLRHNGARMSKSAGNVVDPFVVLNTVPGDALRYYLCAETVFGKDGDFIDTRLVERYNNDLANGLGNLISRTSTLMAKLERLPAVEPPRPCDQELLALVSQITAIEVPAAFDRLDLSGAVREWMKAVNACNAFIQERQPWNKANHELDNERTLSTLWRAIGALVYAIEPVIPDTAKRIIDFMKVPTMAQSGNDSWYRWLAVRKDMNGNPAEYIPTKAPAFFPRIG